MSGEQKPDLARGWLFVEGLLAEEEAKRIEKLSEAELDAELRADGVDPDRVPSAEALLERAVKRAREREVERARAPASPPLPRVVPIERAAKRRLPVRWLVAAGFALLLGALAATKGSALVAFFRSTPEPILPDHEKPKPVAPRELAQKLRDEAEDACAGRHFGLCGDKLDDAKKLDPAGESEPRAQRLRQAIVDGTKARPELERKQ